MLESVERERGSERNDRLPANWRVVASAWVLVALLGMLSAGAQALASLHAASPRHTALAGAVIPRHDPACAGTRSGGCPGFDTVWLQMVPYGYSGM
jgi:hypothetical protein